MGLPVSTQDLVHDHKVVGSNIVDPTSVGHKDTVGEGPEGSSSDSLKVLLQRIFPIVALLAAGGLLDSSLIAPRYSWIVSSGAIFCVLGTFAMLLRVVLRRSSRAIDFNGEPYLTIVVLSGLVIPVVGWVRAIILERGAEVIDSSLQLASLFAALLVWLEFRSFLKSRIVGLSKVGIDLYPTFAWKKSNFESPETKVDPSSLRVGDLCISRHEDIIPCDGVIERGTAVLYERNLSGKTSVRCRGVGDDVYAASAVLSGEIVYRVVAEQRDARITSFSQMVNAMEEEGDAFLALAKGPALLALLFVAGCVILGWNGLKLDWATIFNSASAVLMCASLIDFGMLYRALPRLFARQSFFAGVLFHSKGALLRLGEIKNLVLDRSHDDLILEREITSLALFDERIDRGQLESALLALFSRAGEDLASTFEKSLAISISKLAPCPLKDFHEYPGLGMTATIEQAELSVGSEEFIVARGVRLQPSEIIQASEGSRPIYVAINDEVVCRFILVEPKLGILHEALHRLGVRMRVWGSLSSEKLDAFGKRVGIELALIAGGLTQEQYREKLVSLKSVAVIAGPALPDSVVKAATSEIAIFDPVRWNVEQASVLLFGNSREVVEAAFSIARRYRTAVKAIGGIGMMLTSALLILACLAYLTPAIVLVVSVGSVAMALYCFED